MTETPGRKYRPVNLDKLKTYPTEQRRHKVAWEDLAQLPPKDASAAEMLDSLPNFLGANQLRRLSEAMASAFKRNRPVFFALGAHVIKVGCSPIIIDLMARDILSGIILNGAGGIHDFEMAFCGQTSEDVAENLEDGRFGMTTEAPEALAEAARLGRENEIGLAPALGQIINQRRLAHRQISLLASAEKYGKLSTMHVALGTDTVHMHPQADGADIGAASMIDFRRLCTAAADLADGGVWVNIGSAVVLPEVFLKAVAVARNLGADLDEMYTANLDMIDHYRPRQNVLSRPARPGHSFAVTGHHEIILPLLRMWLLQLL
ncbi:MAG: hypothetical protein AMJ79_07800 [Phycisphaerae bacterium SM23_30]|nr:MAG: hypothetical protein AMJ79_07800 [Phycisphaerae bacterium SM23_30]